MTLYRPEPQRPRLASELGRGLVVLAAAGTAVGGAMSFAALGLRALGL